MKIIYFNYYVVAAALCCRLLDAATASPFVTKLRVIDSPGGAPIRAIAVERQVLLGIRGGDVVVSEAAEGEAVHPLVTKIRNVFRSLLEIGDRKSPKISKILRRVIRKLESVLGINLLPQPEPELRKRAKRREKP
jgi:hypothetical protein